MSDDHSDKKPQDNQKPQDNSPQRDGINRRKILLSGTSLIAAAAAAGTLPPAPAQAHEILPFPPKPSGSTANRTMQESVYSPRPAVRRLPDKAPFAFNGRINEVKVKYL